MSPGDLPDFLTFDGEGLEDLQRTEVMATKGNPVVLCCLLKGILSLKEFEELCLGAYPSEDPTLQIDTGFKYDPKALDPKGLSDPLSLLWNKIHNFRMEMQEQQRRLNLHADRQSDLRAAIGAVSHEGNGVVGRTDSLLKTLSGGMDAVRAKVNKLSNDIDVSRDDIDVSQDELLNEILGPEGRHEEALSIAWRIEDGSGKEVVELGGKQFKDLDCARAWGLMVGERWHVACTDFMTLFCLLGTTPEALNDALDTKYRTAKAECKSVFEGWVWAAYQLKWLPILRSQTSVGSGTLKTMKEREDEGMKVHENFVGSYGTGLKQHILTELKLVTKQHREHIWSFYPAGSQDRGIALQGLNRFYLLDTDVCTLRPGGTQ